MILVLQLLSIFCYAGVLFVLSYLGIKKKIQLSIKSILIIGIILRVIVSFSFISLKHYDTISYFTIGTLSLQGKTIYPGYAYYHYPYFPGFIYIEALSIFFQRFGFPYMLFLKLVFSLFDIFNIYFVYIISKKNTRSAFLYAVNPAMIFLSSAH